MNRFRRYWIAGLVILLALSVPTRQSDHAYASDDSGLEADWLPVGGADLSSSNVASPSIFVYEGTPYVAYLDSTKSSRVTVKRFQYGKWEAVGDEGFTVNNVYDVDLYVDNGIPYVGFGSNGATTVMKYVNSNWEKVGEANVSTQSGKYVSIFVENEVPYISYRASNSVNVYTYSTTGNWVKLADSSPFQSLEQEPAALYVEDGIPYLAYYNTFQNHIVVRKYTDGQWSQIGFSHDIFMPSGVSMVVANGTPYIGYRDFSNYPVVISYNEELDWMILDEGLPSSTSVGSFGLEMDRETGQVYAYDTDEHSMEMLRLDADDGRFVPAYSYDTSMGYVSLSIHDDIPYLLYTNGQSLAIPTVLRYAIPTPPQVQPDKFSVIDQYNGVQDQLTAEPGAVSEANALVRAYLWTDSEGAYDSVEDSELSAPIELGMSQLDGSVAAAGIGDLPPGVYRYMITATDLEGYESSKDTDALLIVTLNRDNTPSSTITPGSATFDKNTEEQEDVVVTLALHGNTLSSVQHDSTVLQSGVDYTLADDTVTITKEYLANQSVGTLMLLFEFSAGESQTLTITIIDTPTPTPTPAPQAPEELLASSGDRQVTLSWSAVSGATSYSVYSSMQSGEYNNPAIASVAGSTYSYTVTGLTNGSDYYFVVTSSNGIGESSFSDEIHAVPIAPSQSSPPSSTIDAPLKQTNNESIEISLNGNSLNLKGTMQIIDNNETIALIFTIDTDSLSEAIAPVNSPVTLVIPITTEADDITVNFSRTSIKALMEKQSTIVILTNNGNYQLPLSSIMLNEIVNRSNIQGNADDMVFSIQIARANAGSLNSITRRAAQDGFKLIGTPTIFTTTATFGDVSLDTNPFTGYVRREIPLPAEAVDIEPLTAIVWHADNTYRSVPTYTMERGGQTYAVISSLTNSTYAIVSYPVTFSDVANHWAKAAVEDMGARLIVHGIGASLYSPDREVTRAEFASIVIRALGIEPADGAAPFTDVFVGDWYHNEVLTAYRYKLVSGYEDGTFRPHDKITREQAMLIIDRAMSITGLRPTSTSDREHEEWLVPFTDSDAVSEWAKHGLVRTLQSGILEGKSSSMLAPKDDLTRAEAAVIIHRLLKKSSLI